MSGLNSMTGFASLSGDDGAVKWDWELRSVNGKGLDFRLRLPEGYDALEPILRREAKARLSRGNVTLTLRCTDRAVGGAVEVQPAGLEAALAALAKIEEAAQSAGVDLAPATAAAVAELPGVLGAAKVGEAGVSEAIQAQVPELFTKFVEMRGAEGEALRAILLGQMAEVAEIIEKSAVTAEARSARAGDLMRQKVAALVDATDQADPARLQQELALLAVKADVTEELDRLRAHVDAGRALIEVGGAVGRKLDFLMQEFNREANTLCSKSGSQELTALGMDLKVLIDQMREQVQNLE